jgi:hypothetical protein
MISKRRIEVFISTLLLCLVLGYSAFADSLWGHNGSVMRLVADDRSVLQLDDVAANSLLQKMMRTGDLRNRSYAEVWVVLVSVALGTGLEKCGFPQPDNTAFLFEPAFDSMTEDQIFVLNRLITKNYRESETDKFVNLGSLYSITKAAVVSLSNRDQTWNCRKIAQVWEKAMIYMKNK